MPSPLQVFLIYLSLVMDDVNAQSFLPQNFTRWFWQNSVVAGNWLYIDGGEVWNNANIGSPTAVLNLTLAIDLSISWSNATVSPKLTEKPLGFPLARHAPLWHDSIHNLIYAFGGWPYAGSPLTWPDNFTNDVGNPHQTVWHFQTDGYGSGAWRESSIQPVGIVPAFGALDASSPHVFYSLGGGTVISNNVAWANPGLSVINTQLEIWKNESSAGYGGLGSNASPYGALGEAAFVPMFGDQGVVVFVGGYTPSSQEFAFDLDPGSRPSNMSAITVYDIATGTFAQQTATGTIPPGRWAFCMVGVSDASNKSYDMFVHGGYATFQLGEPYQADLANIFVLSLPSFTWTRIANSTATMRGAHTCEIIGKRQMLVIGGDDPVPHASGATPDPWTNGLGIYDMSALSWANSYDANAAPYQRAAMLTNVTRKSPFPSSWDNPLLQRIFQPPPPSQSSQPSQPSLSSQSSQPSQLSQPSDHSYVGAVAGGAISGVVVVSLLVLGAFCILRRQRRHGCKQQQNNEPQESYNSNEKVELSALETEMRPELGFALPWELDTLKPRQQNMRSFTNHPLLEMEG